jgi:hypothetical protein
LGREHRKILLRYALDQTLGGGPIVRLARTLAVRANSVIYLPAGDEREIRAAAAQGLEFFAITAPAFSSDDYVQLPP